MDKWPKLTVFLLCLLGLATNSAATGKKTDPFAELDQAITELESELESEQNDSQQSEFEAWKSQYLSDYAAFRQQHYAELDAFRDQLISQWGEAKQSTASEFVKYSADLQTRTSFDFETDSIEVSFLHPSNQQISQDAVHQALTEATQNLNLAIVPADLSLEQKAQISTKQAFDGSQSQQTLQAEIARIKQQSQAQKQQLEKIHDLHGLAQRKWPDEQQMKRQKAIIDQESGKRIKALKQTIRRPQAKPHLATSSGKQITSYRLSMPPKSHLAKAKRYQKTVSHQSKRWGLPPSLSYAIMHTESHFNPRAQSHVPAYGLMQIVPTTAGVDVNRFLYEKDAPMTAGYLYSSEQNIEAGIAYLHLLNDRYLAAISNPQSRYYCVIAAYNTGAGNLARAFNNNGSRNLTAALKVINRMKPEQVLAHLLQHLPYQETKDYVGKVLNRQQLYRELDVETKAI